MKKKFNLSNNIFGWLCFAVAAFTYISTAEPSGSFWDCGEFVTTGYKLEIGHPPGAPFFMLTARFASLFASAPDQVAKMVNIMSALLSALTILFLFWTVTHLARKIIYRPKEGEMTWAQHIIIIGSGLVGALAYTFSDTFWFSAVEGEVYAYSSMFTALVFWLILKWEDRAHLPGSDKWLVLIAYSMGLSIGVHLLNLLCLPAIVMIYYYKKNQMHSAKGLLLAILLSFGLIVALMWGIIPGLAKLGGWFDLFFVNTLGFAYNTGLLAYIVLLFAALLWGVYETYSKNGNAVRAKIAFILSVMLSGITFIGSSAFLWILLIGALAVFMFVYRGFKVRILNTTLLCLLMIIVGYSSFALIPIRSAANTPMDQNSPDDAFSLQSYLNREQYGDSPLLKGKTFASKVKAVNNGEPIYMKKVKDTPNDPDKYEIKSYKPDVEWTKTMLFPRMHSDRQTSNNYQAHLMGYQNWGGVTDNDIARGNAPTFMQNLRFFFSYQCNYMYWRYFMWNFSGRQNDIQGNGGISSGNWITGFNWFDEHILQLGDQSNLPPDTADSKAHNTYFMLPFLLGIAGIIFQLTNGRRGREQFWTTLMLFFMTGIAIVMYLNQKPFEPRERDYAYAGSFYAYAIWLGLGTAGIWQLLKKYLPKMQMYLAAAVTVICLLVPFRMASQNWDDHDRSNRYIMRDVARNYLDSCEPNSIIFCNGDNDTFPLWYIQEVEGYRTDIRTCNLSYAATDWYIDQMRRQAYNSPPLPIDWDQRKYQKYDNATVLSRQTMIDVIKQQFGSLEAAQLQGFSLDQAFDQQVFADTVSLDFVMAQYAQPKPYFPRQALIQKETDIIPGRYFYLDVKADSVNWTRLGTKPVDKITLDIGPKQSVYRNDLLLMELLKSLNRENWNRTMYFCTTVSGDMWCGLDKFFMNTGLANQVVPGEAPNSQRVNTDTMFNNVINKFHYTSINEPKTYFDEANRKSAYTYRMMFAKLINALFEEGKTEKALIATEKCMKVIPYTTVKPMDRDELFAEFYYRLGMTAKGDSVINLLYDYTKRSLDWYLSLSATQMQNNQADMLTHVQMYINIAKVLSHSNRPALFNKVTEDILSCCKILHDNGVPYRSPDNSQPTSLGASILNNMMAIGNEMYSSPDTAMQTQGRNLMDNAIEVMKTVNPGLYNQFSQNPGMMDGMR
jgi:hypothetical protein